MGAILPYDITRAIEKIIPDPEIARKVIETIEEGITAIEEKAKDQKIIIKSEVKDELTKELVTKEELKATEKTLRGEIKATEERLRGEIKATEERLRGEIKATEERLRTEIHKWRADTIKWMFIFWMGQIAALVGVLKIMLK